MNRQINTFWKREHEETRTPKGDFVTIPGMAIEISSLLKTGDLDTVSQKIAKRMIYGKRVTIDDLTGLDYFANTIKRYNNLLRVKTSDKEETIDTKSLLQEPPEPPKGE